MHIITLCDLLYAYHLHQRFSYPDVTWVTACFLFCVLFLFVCLFLIMGVWSGLISHHNNPHNPQVNHGESTKVGTRKWAIPDKFCPPPIEDVSATYANNLEFHLLFCKIFLEIQSKKTKKCGF